MAPAEAAKANTRAFEASIALENSDAFAVAAERPEPKGLMALPPALPRLVAAVDA
jgi:hypothetical protein